MALTLNQNPDQIFPANILEEPINGTTWWVAHTKSRREKSLANFLSAKRIGYYLPLIKKRQASNKRERFSFMPLFSGYMFFKGSKQDRYEAFTSNQIARVIEVKDQSILLNELARTQKALSIGGPVYPYDFLAKGQKAQVRFGPMKGIEGIITDKKGQYRLILNVTTISQSFAVDVEADMVEAI
jgi:transcription antitermination factor NusG